MSEIVHVPHSELKTHYATALKAHAKEQRRRRSYEGIKITTILGLGALCGWLGYSNGKLAIKASEVPTVFVTLRDDGTLTNSVKFTSMPPAIQNDVTINSLWSYVEARECYNKTRAERDWYVVQAMSDARVGREWRDWFGPNNKNSPQHVYGDKGFRVDCKFVGYQPLDRGRYEFTYDRWEVTDKGQNEPLRYVASITYRTGIYSSDPSRAWIEKSTFNASGVQVTEYPKPHPEAVAGKEMSAR